MKSQNDAVLGALKRGEPVTPMSALKRFGCFRLAARIYELREVGYTIRTYTKRRNGKRFATYQLEA